MKGVSRRGKTLRVYVRVGNLPQKETHFPVGTPAETIKRWRDKTRETLRSSLPRVGAAGSLHADADRYLRQVKAMPTYTQRRNHINLWIEALGGDTPRHTITPEPIRAVLNAWKAGGLSAATCNKRRSALMHLWTVLDGKGAQNPVRDVPKFYVDDPLPRGRDPHVVDAALLAAPACRTRACLRVMLWTGMRPVELHNAQPDDVDLEHRTVIVRTGKKGRVRVVPLTEQGVAAWKEFAAAGCWDEPKNAPLTEKRGTPRKHKEKRIPDSAPMGRLLKKWTGLKDLRVYDTRHSYGTALARRQTRLDVIASLLGHSTLELTRRYTLAAVTPDAQQATAALGQKLSSK